ncbi:mitochondrial import inner membrane translocase subunit TIM44 isoform X1 [Passer montanus]|uniref:mitochondrial import inner membrane translocase subunit TIM44 isoform X1 n=1 Tax=Passer montanus TaxID=9160 RepID=UPI001962170E|nr:mitochondrial import inner membrane translocase subunit TIM44 isoform X1 [Passer montanus]
MKESIKKFRDEAKKLEESDALREARRKYKTIESETVKTSEVIKKKLEEITGTVKESLDEVSKSDLGRKIKEGVEEAAKTAKQSAESVTRGGEKLGRTAAFKAISQGVETVKKEIDESVLGQTGPYRRPERLRKRTEYSGDRIKEQRVFEANEEAMGMVLHKDSKWYQQWKDFKDNNVVFNRFFEMKMKYDESDNAFIRASRAVTDRVTDLIGGLFSKTEMSEVLTEILRVDPSFDKDRFLKQCERDIIPNVLEALISGELDILKDWCYEATYSQLAHPIQQAKALGLQFHSRILDIDNIDVSSLPSLPSVGGIQLRGSGGGFRVREMGKTLQDQQVQPALLWLLGLSSGVWDFCSQRGNPSAGREIPVLEGKIPVLEGKSQCWMGNPSAGRENPSAGRENPSSGREIPVLEGKSQCWKGKSQFWKGKSQLSKISWNLS